MGKKSEVFVLNMGDKVKIKELIYKMIRLSGFTVKDSKNPLGDIEIRITGLRPGEKLFEELLIEKIQKNSSRKNLQSTRSFYSL